jgi:hypothetical protein
MFMLLSLEQRTAVRGSCAKGDVRSPYKYGASFESTNFIE